MRLPRWTAYLALAMLAVFLITAIPKGEERPSEGAAEAARAGGAIETKYPRVVVLGIDGLDPDILADVIARYPERMTNFAKLMGEADGITNLGTSTPPQSPVAWSNFIVGRNPGGHGIFDFIHRDPEHYTPLPGTVTKMDSGEVSLPGKWQFPTSSGGDTNRTGKAFWTILGEHGVPADVWRMPINFPVEPSKKGWSFPGMMTPAVDSAYGEPSLYSTDPPAEAISDPKIHSVTVRNGVARVKLLGPANAFIEGTPRTEVDFEVYVDEDANAAVIEIAGSSLVMEPGEWSTFVKVSFSMLPMGAMDQAGIVRFYLRSVTPELEFYASPVNVDPTSPISPVSAPESAAQELAEAIGLYYTQGMAEDVNALKKQMLTDAEFMRQAQLVYDERGRMLDLALTKYMKNEEGGFLFFYYSSVDLCCHMMWRHTDPSHPFFDPELAAQDSSWWSQREGSTWRDVVDDLYLRMDPILGEIRERIGEDTTLMVMSDHGFAAYRRKFSLNTWLLEEGYLVLQDGQERETPEGDADHREVKIYAEGVVDWSKTRAYGMGFNALYINLEGREAQGSVPADQVPALVSEIKAKLEAVRDVDGTVVVLSADRASDVYQGERLQDAPELLVGYNRGYGNSDEASLGHIPNQVLSDNTGGTFNGSHLMDPSVVTGTLLTNRRLMNESPRLEDLTVEILKQYGIKPDAAMVGRPVLRDSND
jgi:predicted AlkP superfamily phosphohydrolase/phosphomutase